MSSLVGQLSVIIDRCAVAGRHGVGEHAYGLQVREVFDHLRLEHSVLDTVSVPHAPGVVVVAEAGADAPSRSGDFERWVRRGGVLVLTDRELTLAGLAGVTTTPHGNGLVSLDGGSWSQRPARPLRALNGVTLTPEAPEVEVLASWVADEGSRGGAAITRRPVGAGEVICVGVDLWETVVRTLQGDPVHADHAPAADGSAPLDDGVLKCEDGLTLDLDADRALPPGQPPLEGKYPFEYPPVAAPPIFDLPQADLWASALAQLVWTGLDRTADGHGWLHYWPAGVPAMAHMSHDSDGNHDEDARAALDSFAEGGVPVTWCQIYRDNCYSPEVYDEITAAGHEHGLHFNAMDDADIAQWGWEQARRQYAWAQEVIGVDTKITSNKNHYTRWEGWTEFYDWCERLGITVDESRGPSKPGTVGFPFGTAHVDFPLGDVAVGNRRMDVLNLPLHVQDLGWFGHISSRDVILDGALEVHGVAHFLFHGLHLRLRPMIRSACVDLASAARGRGMLWWTARQIDTWERSRRGVDIAVRPTVGHEDTWTVSVGVAHQPLACAGVLVSLPGQSVADRVVVRTETGVELPTATVVRHGRTWHEITTDLVPGTTRWTVTRSAAAVDGDGRSPQLATRPIDERRGGRGTAEAKEMEEQCQST
ncbi:hypothetical protein [Microlunatus sp. Y2014]|uniref:hypothetical protein n=1 Tax=Microlunatus sp. Y2014 TaxID=3418488 RepID=UPI003DA734F8